MTEERIDNIRSNGFASAFDPSKKEIYLSASL